MKLTDYKQDTMALGELWEELAKVTNHIVEDNKLYPDNYYPLEVRLIQMLSIDALINAIKQHHDEGK